jgi:hypothetical protein
MPHIIRFIKTISTAIAALFVSFNIAHATPIQFIYTGVGSGSLGQAYFTNASFTIRQYSDTANIENFGCTQTSNCLSLDANSASVSIDGFGTYSFVTGTRTFFNAGIVGLSRAGIMGSDLYDVFYTGPDYALNSSIGPIAMLQGAVGLLQWGTSPVITEGGTLNFLSLTTPGTFQAIAAVPLPATAWLFGSGLIALAGRTRRPSI